MISYGETNVGKIRVKNDDSFYCSDGNKGLYIVADGMGGYRGGKLASQIAVDTTVAFYANHHEHDYQVLLNLIQKELQKRIDQSPEYKQMGTTLTAVFARGNQIDLLHIGDSRAYLITDSSIRQITEDHTYVNVLYKNGEISKQQMQSHPKRGALLRVITAYDSIDADLLSFELKKGETILLCSDGLTEHVNEEDILEILNREDELSKAGKSLVHLALERGGTDNIAIVLLRNQ